MFINYVKIALRNIRKNKLFAVINILGLSVGLTIYVFGNLLVDYEQSHDAFFEHSDRIYSIGSHAAPGLGVGVELLDSTFSALGPIIESEVAEVEQLARTIRREFLVSMGSDEFYQSLLFSDPALLHIFDFDYLSGDESALEDASGIVITESTAIRYFGDTNAKGKVVTFDNEFDFHISAVIKEVPLNSHFNSQFLQDAPFQMIAPMKALTRMRDYPEEGDWNNLSIGNLTYVLLPATLDGAWFQGEVDRLFASVVPEEVSEVISGFVVNPLAYANVAVWDLFGMPIIGIVKLLSLLVLFVACVNYTNLATAQSLGRTREVGMRKTMGAGRWQLLIQFLVESLTIAGIAMIIAVAMLEIVIPLFNNATNKVLALDYIVTLPWLLMTTSLVGLLAGAYPAWLITKTTPIDALRDIARKGKKGSAVRSVMIGAQFAISAFMLALVTIVYMQNEQVKESSNIFPRSEIYTLDRLNVEGIRDRLDTLGTEFENIPNVESVAFSSQVPFEQSNSQTAFSVVQGDESGKMNVHQMSITPEFLDVYGIPVIAGRNLSREAGKDMRHEESESVNVLINELAVEKFGFDSPQAALNQRLFDLSEDNVFVEAVVVGILPTQNILGLFNSDKAWMFSYNPENLRIGSVRIKGDFLTTIPQVEDTWDDVIPDYPIQGKFLDEVFNDVYDVMKTMNAALAGFAFVALTLALVGLFGLAAFMAAQRTREIGIRKVLGANSAQITRLLVWQFSKPVLWALMIALPVAYFASENYLNFFADRIESPALILLVAGAIAVLLAWATVAGHAYKIARAKPIYALRYE